MQSTVRSTDLKGFGAINCGEKDRA